MTRLLVAARWGIAAPSRYRDSELLVSRMRIIYCSEPFAPGKVDPAYRQEADAARRVGFDCSLVSFEALVDDRDAATATRRVAPAEASEIALYRGWMLRPESYAALYGALHTKGLTLVNTPEQYRHCHYLPASYDAIREHTPRTVWLPVEGTVDFDAVWPLLEPFGDAPLVVKDYVKSRKHEWDEACFIPSAADHAAVERVVRRFLELQGDDLEDLNEGLVFREFVEFEPLAEHSKSGMPLTKEYRLFFLDGRLLFSAEYWEEGDYGAAAPPVDRFLEVAASVRSRFFTMDVAKRRDGEWMIVELGDAQVAGLPDRADVDAFYTALAQTAES
jgi:hypothetical protein